MFNEIWKDIPDYDGLYQVSNYGKIRTCKKHGPGINTGCWKIMTPQKNWNGYLRVSLFKNGKRKNYRMHRLVWEIFNGPIPDGYEVNHINEDKTDNRIDNLNLLIRKENINYGECVKKRSNTKKKHIMQYDLEGNELCEWWSTKDVMKELGYISTIVSNCCLGRTKTAYGFIWKYA